MVITPHALLGALLGRSANCDPDAVLRGCASHFVLDRVPHYDYDPATGYGLLLAADALCAVALVRWLAGRDRRAALGALAAVAPDVAQVTERALGVDFHLSFHQRNHTDARPGPLTGTLTQVATVALTVALLRR